MEGCAQVRDCPDMRTLDCAPCHARCTRTQRLGGLEAHDSIEECFVVQLEGAGGNAVVRVKSRGNLIWRLPAGEAAWLAAKRALGKRCLWAPSHPSTHLVTV